MDTVFSILVVLGMCYGVYRGMKWMLHTGQVRKDPPLSPNDLKVLEETASRLMSDLQLVTDECVERIQIACSEAEKKIISLQNTGCSQHLADPTAKLTTPNVQQLVDPIKDIANESAANIARLSGMTTGEVELLRSLQSVKDTTQISIQ